MSLLRVRNLYENRPSTVETFDADRLNVLRGVAPPLPLVSRLHGEPLDMYRRFDECIELGAVELDEAVNAGELLPIRPYWDVRLRRDRGLRIWLLQRLVQLGLGGYRRRAKGFVGLFCVTKKHQQQRLIVDARYASQCCRRPPGVKLGSAASLASLDLSAEALSSAGVPADADLHAVAVDLTDCFYQFTVPEAAEWFACEWPERAGVWGATEVW